ncbi:hypothetical protein [Agromyces humi]|uniref:hypothetical protein n=1 Tax=Agromyces humi TaxID=1766800 RepID=UPI001357C1A2|nr:hypothetical protein [Agromyces humi]
MPSQSTNSRPKWIIPAALAAVVAVVVAGCIAAFTFGWFGLGGGTSTAAAPTSTPSGALPTEQVAALEAQLESGDPAQLSVALALDESQLTPEMTSGFGTSDLVFDTAAAVQYEHAWDVPVTVTTEAGDTSEWIATIIDTEDGLVLGDTRAAE